MMFWKLFQCNEAMECAIIIVTCISSIHWNNMINLNIIIIGKLANDLFCF